MVIYGGLDELAAESSCGNNPGVSRAVSVVSLSLLLSSYPPTRSEVSVKWFQATLRAAHLSTSNLHKDNTSTMAIPLSIIGLDEVLNVTNHHE